MGTKMQAAVEACFPGEVVAGRKVGGKPGNNNKRPNGKRPNGKKPNGKKPNKKPGNKKPCPTFDEIMEGIQKATAGHRCIMEQMEWVDDQGEVNKEVMMTDMDSLNSAVTDNMSENDIHQCVNKTMTKMAQNPMHQKCKDKYSEEEQQKLGDTFFKMVYGKCGNKSFIRACTSYVKMEMDNFDFMAHMAQVNSAAGETTDLPAGK